MIIIIDYGMGNIRSIQKHFERMDVPSIISSDPKAIEKAKKLILPGVGHFATGMKNLKNSGLIETLNQKVFVDKVPILGICLGMQLFTKWSEEGNSQGLGWLDAETKKFNFKNHNNQLKIPHMGWNTIEIKKENDLLKKISEQDLFYFVHSYHVICNNKADILATSYYGYSFTSIVHKENIFGTQFHPEKSHLAGMQIIKNFIEVN